ncbi:MAG TPA: ABC transporter permease, partial [Gemmatimonadales bacterium]|nr:ABC transporter permease [Gemmatimonadales bacterium]
MQHSFGTAIRWLTSAPLVTLLVVLTIGLGVGASTAILGALESVINPFRFEHADRTFVIWRGMRDRDLLLPPVGEQVELWRRATAFEQLEAFTVTEMTLTGRGPAEWLQVAHISPSLPALVGAEPVLGRGFAVESQPGAPPVVILSHALWKTRFGAQPVLGQTVTLDGMSRTIVGVMPPHFKLPSPLSWRYDALVPLVPSAELGNLTVAARLRDGVTPAQAEEELAALGLAAAEAGGGPRWTGRVLEPEFFARNVRETLELLMVAVGLLLLICCVNVSNLLLAQGHSRAREMAVRAALGAKRGRLLLELLLSSVILGLGGAITGVLLAIWGSDLLLAIRPDDLRSLERLSLNPTVLGFAVTLSVGTGVVVGLVPAFRLSSTRSLLLLRGGGGTEPRGAFGRRFRLALVVVQVALSFALLVESGLLVRSVARQVQVPLGFEAQRLAVVDASAPQWKFPDDRTTSALFHEIRDRIAALPGVESASLAVGVPPRAAIFFGDLEIDGRPGRAAQNQAVFFGGSVDADYFTTVGQSIVAGRGFTPEEVRQGASVRIIGEGAARRFFPGGAAIGMRMRLGSRDPWSTIVGIAADVRAGGLGEAGDGLQ